MEVAVKVAVGSGVLVGSGVAVGSDVGEGGTSVSVGMAVGVSTNSVIGVFVGTAVMLVSVLLGLQPARDNRTNIVRTNSLKPGEVITSFFELFSIAITFSEISSDKCL